MFSKDFDLLTQAISRCLCKKTSTEKSSSLVQTRTGHQYIGSSIDSDTNLLAISSEQIALAMSVLHQDFPAKKILTLREDLFPFSFSPLILKILVDYTSRTQEKLAYQIINTNGKTLFETQDVRTLFPLYQPKIIPFSQTTRNYSPNKKELGILKKEDISHTLKQYALEGLSRNFPLYETASGYGSAVYTSQGIVYFAGQFSSPDKRLGLHSEMNAILSALMNNDTEITHIGVVSTKYPDTPCQMCGICRQFIAEISSKFALHPTLYCFAKEREVKQIYTLEEYLPYVWTSKKW